MELECHLFGIQSFNLSIFFLILTVFNKLNCVIFCYSSYQPMDLISSLSAHVLATSIKPHEKIKPLNVLFLIFSLNSQNFSECKNRDF